MHNRSLVKLFSKLPAENVWMLVVDGRFHASQNGPEGYESREPNSIAGVLNGLMTALKDINQDLTVEQICATHRACMEGVKSKNPCEPGKFRTNPVISEIRPEWVTVERVSDFLASSKGKPKLLIDDKALKNNTVVPLSSLTPAEKVDGVLKLAFDMQAEMHPSVLENPDFLTKIQQRNLAIVFSHEQKNISSIPVEVKKIVDLFNQGIRQAQSENEKLLLLAKLTQDLLRQEHPFRDGNNRLFVNCILLRLLARHFGKLALFFDPNVFEMSTPLELMVVLKEAMLKADAMLANPLAPVFNFDHTTVAEKYVKLGKKFLENILKHSLRQDSRPYFNALTQRLAGAESTDALFIWSPLKELNIEVDKDLTALIETTRLTIYSL
jgi:hypothetical protein